MSDCAIEAYISRVPVLEARVEELEAAIRKAIVLERNGLAVANSLEEVLRDE